MPIAAPRVTRSRPLTAALLVATVLAGLASRRFAESLPRLVAEYAGDTLWATMVFWLLAFIKPSSSTRRLSLAALCIAVGVELSQLYHAPWLDALRNTTLGHLALGQGFLASDLWCYAAGVALAAALDAGFVARRTRA
jgi:Protein of unknown function (DUF2809)